MPTKMIAIGASLVISWIIYTYVAGKPEVAHPEWGTFSTYGDCAQATDKITQQGYNAYCKEVDR